MCQRNSDYSTVYSVSFQGLKKLHFITVNCAFLNYAHKYREIGSELISHIKVNLNLSLILIS